MTKTFGRKHQSDFIRALSIETGVRKHLLFGSDLLLDAKSTTEAERLSNTYLIRSKLAPSQISSSTKNKYKSRCERATECMHLFAAETLSCNANKKLFSGS